MSRIKVVSTLAALLISPICAAPSIANASPIISNDITQADLPTISGLVIHSKFNAKSGVDVVLTFDSPVPVSTIDDELERQGDDASTVVVQGNNGTVNRRATVKSSKLAAGTTPQGTGPAAANLQCNRFYSYSDFDGSYTIQRACASQYAPWGLKLSAYWQSHVVGLVNERGLDWKLNGANRPRQAPHPGTSANYTFHGTYSGIRDRYNVSYQDLISFRHNLGPGGEAAITFYGDHTFLGEDGSTCQPGKPC